NGAALRMVDGGVNGFGGGPDLLTQSETISNYYSYSQPGAIAITTDCNIDGTYNQTAGAHIIRGALQIGNGGTSRGVYNLSGGLLDASAASGTNWSEVLAYNASGNPAYFNQTGGTNLSGVLVLG